MKNYLIHYGMPRRSGRYPFGSGERPFQGESPEVRKKAADMTDQELSDYIKRKNLESNYEKIVKREEGPNKLEVAKNAANEASNAINKINNELRSDNNNQQPKWERMDLSNMTDKELRDRINRETLEIQYSKMFNSKSPEVDRGREYISNKLESMGKVLAVTGSALGIALAIKQLRN